MAVQTRPLQPEEVVDFAFNYGAYCVGGTTLVSAIGFASRSDSANPTASATTLSNTASIGDRTIGMVAHPGIGALLTIEPSGLKEVKKVEDVVGTGPYVVLLHSPLSFVHNSATAVNYFPGVSATFLQSTTGTIISNQYAKFRAKYGVDGMTYRLSSVGMLSTSELIEGQVDLVCSEE